MTTKIIAGKVTVDPANHDVEIIVAEAGMVHMVKLKPGDSPFSGYVYGSKTITVREKPKE